MLNVKGHPIKFQIDTGATCNVLRKQDAPSSMRLQETSQVLTQYNGSKIEPIGRCTLPVRNPKSEQIYHTEFVVVADAGSESIIGAFTAQVMGLIQLNTENLRAMTSNSVHSLNSHRQRTQ